jgi:hypothetical protein
LVSGPARIGEKMPLDGAPQNSRGDTFEPDERKRTRDQLFEFLIV